MKAKSSFCIWLLTFVVLSLCKHVELLDSEAETFDQNYDLREEDFESEAEEKSGLFEGDILMDEHEVRALTNTAKISRRDAITEPTLLWPNGIIYYALDTELDDFTRSQIYKGMEHLKLRTCITFRKRKDEKTYVKFFSGKGCYSRIGRNRDNKEQVISIGHGCTRIGTVVHEIMHALGFYHEHTRPDRDQFINIEWKNILDGHTRNFKKYPRGMGTNLGKRYDYSSVLHYSRFAFSNDGDPTIITAKDGALIGQRKGLSLDDVYQINTLYNCKAHRCRDRYHPFKCHVWRKQGRCNDEHFEDPMRALCALTCKFCRVYPENKSLKYQGSQDSVV